MTLVYDLTRHPKWIRQQKLLKKEQNKAFDVKGRVWSFSQISSQNGVAFLIEIGRTKNESQLFVNRIRNTETAGQQKINTEIVKILYRAKKLQHHVHTLARKQGNEQVIVAAKDETEKQILLGPFSDLRNKLNAKKETGVQDFLDEISVQNNLTREKIDRLWNWPVHNTPEIKNNIHIFQCFPTHQIPTDLESRQGMAYAFVIGSFEEIYGKENAIKFRLQNETWKWNMIAKSQGHKPLTLFRQTVHSVVPSLVELAIGAASKYGQDTTLFHAKDEIANIVTPKAVLNLCQGTTLEVIGKTKLMQKIIHHHAPKIDEQDDLVAVGLRNLSQTDELFYHLQQSVFPCKTEKSGSALLWLNNHLQT